VLHGIKKASRGSGTEPELSQAESELPDQVRTFLRSQLTDALKHRREIVEEPGLSTLPGIARPHGSELKNVSSSSAT